MNETTSHTRLLRLATAGSVDDGKSTLVGRLLYDSKSVLADQLEAIEFASRARGSQNADLALLTDGLRAEREQGITIDVAYRYFATPRRRFILADTPGHVQYTRNMVTGASTAQLAIVLVDARKGIVEQTRRHIAVAALLRVPHVVLAVNKMDLVEFSLQRFHEIVEEFTVVADSLGVTSHTAIPLSALNGDNVVTASENMPWYHGPTLLSHLEEVEVGDDLSTQPGRFPVQSSFSPSARPDWAASRCFGFGLPGTYVAGQVAAGTFSVGQTVTVMPHGTRTVIEAIDQLGGDATDAVAGQSVTIHLFDTAAAERGDLIAAVNDTPHVGEEIVATVCHLSERPLRPGQAVLMKYASKTLEARVEQLIDQLDLATTHREGQPQQLVVNDIATVRLRTAQPVAVDSYRKNRITGSFILIDPGDGQTLTAGMVESVSTVQKEPS
ncbi:sulfate adenylyltransferase subunit 1 [Rhizocola hellebori]|uniref:sulfate adenylyltransferase n=1 Tax=Rhizocola hellebori TaxID=1392758 RepID=A0A8J3VG74_9ACTN|nr:GTP-binding protein [Rhizocola hellebori]GIH05155.1 sulfate adenylyltransferase subunit 1 [Rhizocola hellebori]